MSRLLDRDRSFVYVPASKTDIAATWRRFGFKPTTATERRDRQKGKPAPAAPAAPVPEIPARRTLRAITGDRR